MAKHKDCRRRLTFRLQDQLPLDEHLVSGGRAYVSFSPTCIYSPDVAVIPRELINRMLRDEPNALEVYRDPLPLIVQIWSPRTGNRDVTEKLPGYQERGDAEIWLLHPDERALRA